MSPEIEKLQETLAKEHQFTADTHRMDIFGTCKTCSQKETQD
jgi:Fe2+ or Zn2+ uptake regulation protein